MTDDFGRPIDTAIVGASGGAVAEARNSPRTLLGADVRFSKGVKVGIGSSSHATVKAIPENDLLDSGLELFCRGLVLTRVGANALICRREEIVVEPSGVHVLKNPNPLKDGEASALLDVAVLV